MSAVRAHTHKITVNQLETMRDGFCVSPRCHLVVLHVRANTAITFEPASASVDRSLAHKHKTSLYIFFRFFLSSVFISHANVAGIYELLCSCTLHKSIRSRNFKYKFKCDADFLFKFRLEHLPAKCESRCLGVLCAFTSFSVFIVMGDGTSKHTHTTIEELGNVNL